MATAVIMPKAGMSMESGTILRWLKSPGETVRKGEPLLEIETDKLAMEVEAEADGVLLAITRFPGDLVPVTEVIGYLGAPGETVPPEAEGSRGSAGAEVSDARPVSAAAQAEGPRVRVPVRASPLARELARRRGLDLRSLHGTGPGGAVRVRDLPAAPASGSGAGTGAVTAAPVTPARTASARGRGSETRAPLSATRRSIAARMAASHRDIPAVTLHVEADLTDLERLRTRHNERAVTRLSLTPFLLRAAALACRSHPLLRSRLDGQDLVTSEVVDLGMAVALDGGLIVPVIRAADGLGLSDLAAVVSALGRKAREGRLAPDDLGGAVFTVTNLGMYGVTSFDPLIDPPQSAILGVGAARDQVAVVDGQPGVKRVADLALTFDHRILDGAEAAKALATMREVLESPLDLLLGAT